MLDSKAEINADARSGAVTGVLICEEIELSRHHFTRKSRKKGGEEKKWEVEEGISNDQYQIEGRTNCYDVFWE